MKHSLTSPPTPEADLSGRSETRATGDKTSASSPPKKRSLITLDLSAERGESLKTDYRRSPINDAVLASYRDIYSMVP